MQVRPSPRDRSYDFLTSVSLKPGHYNMRVSAHSTARNKSGSVHTDITIPDYAKLPISMSDVVVSAPPARTASPLNAFAGLVPVVPTTAREFARSDRVTVFSRLYWGRDKPPTTVSVVATITDTDNRDVFTQTTPLGPGLSISLRSAITRWICPCPNFRQANTFSDCESLQGTEPISVGLSDSQYGSPQKRCQSP
jgi:hypothetical protein